MAGALRARADEAHEESKKARIGRSSPCLQCKRSETQHFLISAVLSLSPLWGNDCSLLIGPRRERRYDQQHHHHQPLPIAKQRHLARSRTYLRAHFRIGPKIPAKSANACAARAPPMIYYFYLARFASSARRYSTVARRRGPCLSSTNVQPALRPDTQSFANFCDLLYLFFLTSSSLLSFFLVFYRILCIFTGISEFQWAP